MDKVYCVSAVEVQEWRIVRRTAKTAIVEQILGNGRPWTRTIRATMIDQAGTDWFTTPEAALEAAIHVKGVEIVRAKERVQALRTRLGMLEGNLKRLRQSAALPDRKEP